jgi:hypothetical protein
LALVNCQPPLDHFNHICLEAFGNIVNALIPAWINLDPKENFPSYYRRAKISAIESLEKYTKSLDRYQVSIYN